MPEDIVYDVVIVGAAAAGLTSAIYTSRQMMKTLVIGKDLGGQSLLTNDIQNYPGFEKVDGFSLISKFEVQAKRFNAEIVYDEVLNIVEEENRFMIKTTSKLYKSLTVILAFGKTPRDMGALGENEYKGRGLSYCVTCDGPLFRGKTVAVVGATEHAVDAAAMLSDIAEKVYMVSNRDKPYADEDMLALLASKKNVIFIPNSIVKQVNGDLTVKSIRITNSKSGSEELINLDGVFVEMGYIAKTDFIKDIVNLNSRKEIVIDRECQTSHKGIFAAGDVTDMQFKQIVISAGQGAIAALSAYNYLQKLRGQSTIKSDWKTRKTSLQERSE